MKRILPLALAASLAGCMSVPQGSEFYNALLAQHTAQVIGVPQPALVPDGFSIVKSADEDIKLKINGEVRVSSLSLFFGAAVPVTEDGYFLTAYHCVDEGESWILYTSESEKEGSTHFGRVRIVHRNQAGDFAIVKADFETPAYLSIAESLAIRRGKLYVGYSPFNSGSSDATRILKLSRVSTDGYTYNDFLVSGVAKEGDSGSPVIDRKGRVIGILVKSTETSTVCRMMDPVALRIIIQEDRDNHQIHSTSGNRSAVATRE